MDRWGNLAFSKTVPFDLTCWKYMISKHFPSNELRHRLRRRLWGRQMLQNCQLLLESFDQHVCSNGCSYSWIAALCSSIKGEMHCSCSLYIYESFSLVLMLWGIFAPPTLYSANNVRNKMLLLFCIWMEWSSQAWLPFKCLSVADAGSSITWLSCSFPKGTVYLPVPCVFNQALL